jgi:hypothetical protein
MLLESANSSQSKLQAQALCSSSGRTIRQRRSHRLAWNVHLGARRKAPALEMSAMSPLASAQRHEYRHSPRRQSTTEHRHNRGRSRTASGGSNRTTDRKVVHDQVYVSLRVLSAETSLSEPRAGLERYYPSNPIGNPLALGQPHALSTRLARQWESVFPPGPQDARFSRRFRPSYDVR